MNLFRKTDAAITILMVAFTLAMGGGLLSQDTNREIECAMNNKKIYQAMRFYASDSIGEYPWLLPPWEGGTQTMTNAWQHWAALSNFFESPRIFACPSDASKTPAETIQSLLEKGDQAVTYAVGTDATENLTGSILISERNINVVSDYSNCGVAAINGVVSILEASNTSNLYWYDNIHVKKGHIMQVNGSLKLFTSDEIKPFIRDLPENPGAVGDANQCLLKPLTAGTRKGNN